MTMARTMRERFGITRRQAGALAAAAAAAGLLPAAARADGELRTLTWNGYQEPQILGDYIAKYGKMPPATYFADLSEEFSLVEKGGKYDTVHVDLNWVKRWKDAGLLNPIDTARIPRWGDIFDKVKALKGVNLDGQTWQVPCNWGTIALIVRTDLVDPAYVEEPTWGLLWDDRYKGKLATYDDGVTAVIMAALWKGFADPEGLTADQLDEAIAALAAQRDLLRYYWSDSTTLGQSMATGEVVAAAGWSSTYLELKTQGLKVAYLDPKEGAQTWLDGVCWCNTGSGDEQRFYDFANAWLSPQTGAFIINTYGSGHSNRHSFDHIDPARLADLGMTDPVATLSRGHVLEPMDPKLAEAYTTRFDEMKAGS
jgi:spermidine/putrescine transport system substrate-binding protein